MQYQKITNLLDPTSHKVPRFMTKKWIEIYDQSGSAENRYKPHTQARFKTPMLQSDFCDFRDAYIVLKGTTIVPDSNNMYDKKLACKNNAPFTSCISKINNTHIENADESDIVMPMYNLLEYSKNYSKTTGNFWNFYIYEPNSGADNNINYSIKNLKSFNYKTSITENLEDKNTVKEKKLKLLCH